MARVYDEHKIMKSYTATIETWPFGFSKPKDIIFNVPEHMTIVNFSDGTKIKSRAMEGDDFDKQIGLAMCLAKKYLGSRGEFKRLVENAKVVKK
jgi:hypothetical protein